MYYASLKVVPVLAEQFGEFFAPNPWTGNPREKWNFSLYQIVSESFATALRWKFINKEKANTDDLATRRLKMQKRKLKWTETIGFESPDGRIHMLPRVLIELWQAGEVQDQALPGLLKQFEPNLKRSDFKMKRLRAIFKVESYLFLVFAFLALAGFVTIETMSHNPHQQSRPSQADWLAKPMAEQSIWAQGQGVAPQHCFRLRPGLVKTPAGLTTYGDLNLLCSFKAANESRLMLMESYGDDKTLPRSLILRGVVLPPGQLNFSAQLMNNLQQKVPGLNTSYILAYNTDWAGQTSMADFDELKPILGWAVPILILPFLIFLVVTRFWRAHDARLKASFRSTLGGYHPGFPIQPAVQQL